MKKGFLVTLESKHSTYDFSEIDGIYFADRGETIEKINQKLKVYIEEIKANGNTPSKYKIKNLATAEEKEFVISSTIEEEFEIFYDYICNLSKVEIFNNSKKIEFYKSMLEYAKSCEDIKLPLSELYEKYLKTSNVILSDKESIRNFLSSI